MDRSSTIPIQAQHAAFTGLDSFTSTKRLPFPLTRL